MSSAHSPSVESGYGGEVRSSSSRGSTPASLSASLDGRHHYDDKRSRAERNEPDNVSFSSAGQLDDLVDDAREDRERKRQHARVVEAVCGGASSHGNRRQSSSSNMIEKNKDYQALNGHDDVDFMTMNSGSPEADGYVRDLGQRLATLADVLTEEETVIRDTHLKNYVRLPNLKRLLVDVEVACKEYHHVIGQLSSYVNRIQGILCNLSHIVDKKLSNEGLYSWLDGPPSSQAGKLKKKTQIKHLSLYCLTSFNNLVRYLV